MLCLLHPLDEFVFLDAPLAFHSSVGQNLFQLLHPQLGDVLLVHLLRLDGHLDGANFRIALVDALADLERGHPQRKGLRDVALDGIDVVADFLLLAVERVLFAVITQGLFDRGLLAGVLLAHAVLDVLNDFDAD